MEGVDKEKVQRIVYETSKGSKYFENEDKKEALLRQKIENKRAQRAKLSSADLSHYQTVKLKIPYKCPWLLFLFLLEIYMVSNLYYDL